MAHAGFFNEGGSVTSRRDESNHTASEVVFCPSWIIFYLLRDIHIDRLKRGVDRFSFSGTIDSRFIHKRDKPIYFKTGIY